MPISGANPLALIAELQNGADLANYFTKDEVSGLLVQASVGQIVYLPASQINAANRVLKANAAEVLRADYAELWAFVQISGNLVAQASKGVGNFGDGDGSTTFTLPDLRGEFLRSADDGRGVDSGRVVGSGQGDLTKSHSHGASTSAAGNHGHTGTTSTNGNHSHAINSGTSAGSTAYSNGSGTSGTTGAAGNHNHSLSINAAGNHSHAVTVNAAGGSETRPRNVALLACIKY
ncbi:tail fiber protein [Hydrogenovibrio sp. 3SP14C1]|uniref:tail fiber protein n=1 Tax=Hydrogenovibrio sp. 3SP14C1 TaxID=3038774 RepID=UPI0024164BBA|nr:tail fiber protein [Hydrogenovibrio sp. 3SP14C1]MDG4812759.1 tail fiber protein [Hydrogenovibrio sp. 3SP14C1]